MLFSVKKTSEGSKLKSRKCGRTKTVADYMFLKSLGKGSYGSVYRAIERESGSEVAIKAVDLASLERPNGPIEFHPTREVRVCQFLNHKNVIRVHDYFETDQTAFLVMECVKGGDLFDAIKPDYGLPEFRARKYLAQVVKVLDHMHKNGIVHRDIKPENVMIDSDDNIRLIDFGMAGVEEERIRSTAGTIPYMPPELYAASKKHARKHGKEADVWATGVLLFTMLAGNFAWRKPCPKADRSFRAFMNGEVLQPWRNFSPRLMELFRKMLAINPKDRCDISEVLEYINDDWFIPPPTVCSLERRAEAELTSECETIACTSEESGDSSIYTPSVESTPEQRVPDLKTDQYLPSLMEVDEGPSTFVELPTDMEIAPNVSEQVPVINTIDDGTAIPERPKSKPGTRRNSQSSRSGRSRRNSLTTTSVVLFGLLAQQANETCNINSSSITPQQHDSDTLHGVDKYASMKQSNTIHNVINAMTFKMTHA